MAHRKQFLLRLDPALYAELESWAGAELRSVNAQMEYLLRQAVATRKGGRPTVSRTGGAESAPEVGGSGPATGGSAGALSNDDDTTGE
jgi:hypothetical protein